MGGDGAGSLFGPMLLGVLFNTMLYGAMVVQTYVYFQTFKKDARWIKVFISYLLVCETLNTAFDIGMIYEPLIIRYGTLRAVTVAPLMISTNPLMTVLISLPVQLFIAWRVKVMSKSMIIPAIISVFAISSFIGGVAVTICVNFFNEYAHFHKLNAAAITWLAPSAAADVVITTSLVYNLLRRRTGFAATDDLINRLIRMTVQTGLITAISAILDVTIFLAIKGTTLNFIWDFSLSKLYSNSILSTLNARGGWKATSSYRENVLFSPATGGDSTLYSSHKQSESHAIEFQVRRPPSISPTVPVSIDQKASEFEGYRLSVANVPKTYEQSEV